MRFFLAIPVVYLLCGVLVGQENVQDYVSVIQSGTEPVKFVQNVLVDHDLIIFDDAIHSAQEPFDFYQKLLRDPVIQKKVKYIFLEVISITAQASLDAYLNDGTTDPSVLMKAFQDDYSGYGWRYQTYMDLLNTVREVNRDLPPGEKIQVIGVDQPIYWEGIHTRKDYDLFQDSLAARDYFLFRVILEKMDEFKSGKKGFFLTNTRHSYKHLKGLDGRLHWNTATFFDQWYPGRTYSVRIHNVTLFVEAAKQAGPSATAQGLEDVQYRWIRMENGKWDQAFAFTGNKPVAVPLQNNVFGRASYIGNQMLDARPDQTMYDVYDAVIFLAPLEELHVSGKFNFIFTPSFRAELKRRIELMEGEHLQAFLKQNDVVSVDAMIDSLAIASPVQKNPFVAGLADNPGAQ
jgi:hypothetical protein